MNSSIPWLVGIFLFFNPFPHTTAISEISFYLSLLFFLVLLFAGKRRFAFRTPLTLPFALFVIWSCFGLIFALNKANSFHDIYAHLLKYLFIFYMIINFFNSKKGIRILAWIVAISTSIYIIVLMIYNYAVMDHKLNELLGYGFPETSPNILALVALFGLLLSMFLVSKENSLYQNAILTLSICLSVFAILATQSRSGILALTGAVFVVFPKRKKVIVSLFIVAVILTTGFITVAHRLNTDNVLSKITSGDLRSMRERVSMWLCYAQIIKDRPLVGVGFGMQTFYDEKLLMKYNQKVDEKYRMTHLYVAPHNMMIDTAARVGLVGLIFFLAILFAFLGMGWRLIRNGRNEFSKDWSLYIMGAFIAVFIQGMFENTLSGPPAVILYLIFAMMTILWRMQNEPATASREEPTNVRIGYHANFRLF